MVLTALVIIVFVVMLVTGVVAAWRGRPGRMPGDPDDGESTYLRGSNIVNESHDMGGHVGQHLPPR